MATDKAVAADKYRSFLHEEGQNFEWRHGGPPIYDSVNKVFEEGRTKVLGISHLFQTPLFSFMYLSAGIKMSKPCSNVYMFINMVCRNGQKGP